MILRVIDLLTVLLFFGSFPIMMVILGKYNYFCDYVASQFRDDTSEVYDFIVVGAGSAGSVVANRLSKNNKVLLLEAGGNPLFYNYIPILAPNIIGSSEVDWMFKTVPQKNSQLSIKNQVSSWPRGRLLGGTSNLNYMFYVRGHPLDYDLWANITGDDEWKYENVLPFFKKSVDYHGAYAKNEKHYGQTPYGYLHVETRPYKPMAKYFMDAGRELGYEEIDINGPQRSGFATFEVTQKRGERFGTFAAFLKNFMHRDNLRVAKRAQAIKVKLDKNNKAVGVWYVQHGKKLFAKASKEVILSSGTVNSPTLLMHSGIGPRENLESVGIKTKVDLPVGQNLKDHFAVIVFPFFINESLSIIPERDFGLHTFTDYIFKGTGDLTLSTGCHSNAFISTSYVKKTGIDWPDLQMYFMAVGMYENFAKDISTLTSLKREVIEEFIKGHVGKDAFMLMPNLARVRSSGELKLADNNPLNPPRIDPKYLEDKDGHDMKVLVEGIKLAIKLAEGTKSFKSLNAHLIDKHWPGCEKHKLRTDAYWNCYIRHVGMTLYHHVGGCPMGKGVKDPNAVLDSKLRVLRTTGLRVADASIMPEIINGNINAPSIMIGEKASHFIREYWAEQFAVCDRWQRVCRTAQKQCFYSRMV